MASKEDAAVQFWEFVQENLLQFHCENVSWEQASDKIPIKVVVELPGDLITHVNTCLLLRNNRLLFILNWKTIENGQAVWELFFFQNKGFHFYYCNYCGECLNSMTEENIQAHLNDCSQHSSKFICRECGMVSENFLVAHALLF